MFMRCSKAASALPQGRGSPCYILFCNYLLLYYTPEVEVIDEEFRGKHVADVIHPAQGYGDRQARPKAAGVPLPRRPTARAPSLRNGRDTHTSFSAFRPPRFSTFQLTRGASVYSVVFSHLHCLFPN